MSFSDQAEQSNIERLTFLEKLHFLQKWKDHIFKSVFSEFSLKRIVVCSCVSRALELGL